jgi:ribA/ribD-fused uncharacterized protein
MDEYIFFWGDKDKTGFLSNFYPCVFTVDKITYNCSEQYFMKKKQELFDPLNQDLANNIISETNPRNIKYYGRQVRNFNEEIWDAHKYKIMYDGVFAKFTQNPELSDKLLATQDKILVEASPYDKIWGIGFNKYEALVNKSKWGQNLLGHVLMDLRKNLKF